MEKALPTIDIEGTEFIVDVLKNELREKAEPDNTVDIERMLYVGRGYNFFYDTNIKNIAEFEAFLDFADNKHIKDVTIPNLTELDPDGVAEKYKTTPENIKGKTDFELDIIPGSLLDLRWNKKILPIVEIAGHPFFVDLEMKKLRPKDDPVSKGIDLQQIKEYYNRGMQAYIIPYNPSTREFQEIDHLKITELPKDIVIVKFPHTRDMDHVGWNVQYGFGPGHHINEKDYTLHFKAVTLPWEKTNIPNSIKLNLEAQRQAEKNKLPPEKLPNIAPEIKKGRKM